MCCRRENQAISDAKLDVLQKFTVQLARSGCEVSNNELHRFLNAGYTRRHVLDIIMMMPNKLIAVFANRVMGTDLDAALQDAKWSNAALAEAV
ncbi:MAG: hypothetical protein OEZ68_03200 [Gammaproteobacteria bacterium]|nr:hypothetical protein [Gammaproteobacteria bacterium]MDH5799790.1 hypothetical protein [Gammaproteobacteria bacterium]